MRVVICLCLAFLFFACSESASDIDPRPVASAKGALFQLIPPGESGIKFSNELTITEAINPYTYRNFYNGAGVGLGDFNKDGLLDIFFTGNQVDNELYWNRGDFKFELAEEVLTNVEAKNTTSLSSHNSWSTGVVVIDINADGWDDIYVCKSGPPEKAGIKDLDGIRHNELFINQQDGTFTEESAAYGLNFKGLGVHASFFDYDQDGDLDVYLLSNSGRSVSGYDLVKDARKIADQEGGNRLLRCNWPATPGEQITYEDVSEEAGIYHSAIGFGLGVTAGDVDQDGRTDLFVSNDFFERDYLYYNQGNGQFKEALTEQLPEISLGSMGADLADLDNDGLPEIFVTEMLPATDVRYKSKATFQPWNRYQLYRDKGYHQQFSRNVLQWNRGKGRFSEVSRLAGVEATDWSWGALLFDMDGDGDKDIFVANGNGKDLVDQDYVKFDGNGEVIRKTLIQEGKSILTLFDRVPSEKLVNGVFSNQSDLRFSEKSVEWGMPQSSFSNGSAYGDLDNDGDLDLVVSNLDETAFLYRNESQSAQLLLKLEQKGGANPKAIGSKVYAYAGDWMGYQEVQPVRGFQSTVDVRVHFGLGDHNKLDSLKIIWPDGSVSSEKDVSTGLRTISKGAVPQLVRPTENLASTLVKTTVINKVQSHQENNFIDFNQDGLLFWSISNEGPAVAVTSTNTINGQLVFTGGAKGQPNTLYSLKNDGSIKELPAGDLSKKPQSEAVDAVFFDANGDGYEDLYVCNGGYEFGRTNTALLDQLFINDGNDLFILDGQLLPSKSVPVASSCVRPFDVDNDGDLDLFVGGRVLPGQYGLPADSYLLINNGKGQFNAKKIPELGMVTDARWIKSGQATNARLIVVGEFMPITTLTFSKSGELTDREIIAGSNGLWYSLDIRYDMDKGPIILAGNHGLNSRLRATSETPLLLYINDFDGNGDVEQILCHRTAEGRDLPFVLKDDLVAQLPGLRKTMQRYEHYAGKSMQDIFPAKVLERSVVQVVHTLASVEAVFDGGDNMFKLRELPKEAQLQPVYAICYANVNKDAYSDILLGGNQLTVKPEMGIYAAGFGQLLLGNSDGDYEGLNPSESGVDIGGEIRKIIPLGNDRWWVGRSNDLPILINIQAKK